MSLVRKGKGNMTSATPRTSAFERSPDETTPMPAASTAAEASFRPSSTSAAAGSSDVVPVGRCFMGSDIHHRMNFLAQVQKVVSADSPAASSLHSFYGYTLQLLSRRTQSKLHSSLKRMLCKKCSAPLRPGSNSARVRARGRKGSKRLVITCRICETIKRFPTAERTPRLDRSARKLRNANLKTDAAARDLKAAGSKAAR